MLKKERYKKKIEIINTGLKKPTTPNIQNSKTTLKITPRSIIFLFDEINFTTYKLTFNYKHGSTMLTNLSISSSTPSHIPLPALRLFCARFFLFPATSEMPTPSFLI